MTALSQTWIRTGGGPPGRLDADLDACRRWFDPVAQGQRLRRELAQLEAWPISVVDPGPPYTLYLAPQKWLVTPEGRCVIDLLEKLLLSPNSGGYIIDDRLLVPYDRLLAALYRDWGRHRLQSVVDLLRGSNKPLQIPAAGVVIALLVNRCTSEERALTRFASGSPKEFVDRAFFTPVQAFADILSPSHRGNRHNPRLVSGWMLYEARRRLGDGLAVLDARGGIDGKVWIRPESEADVIQTVARDLARGHRARATPERFGDAFDALVAGLRRELPKLAAFGLMHERPRDTHRLRAQFLVSLHHHLAAET